MNFLSLLKRNLIFKFKKKISIDNDNIIPKSLDYLFQEYGSDKANIFKPNQQPGHGYSIYYEKKLETYKNKDLNILEIGSYAGASAAAFTKYLPNSKIYCFDVNISNFKYKSKNINFLLKDILLESDFDNNDLIFSRDFFIHIRINEIKKILDNIKKSNSKFFACSNNYDVKSNNDILIGQHRKVNLFMEPFNLKSPYISFYEGTEDCYIDIFKVSDL